MYALAHHTLNKIDFQTAVDLVSTGKQIYDIYQTATKYQNPNGDTYKPVFTGIKKRKRITSVYMPRKKARTTPYRKKKWTRAAYSKPYKSRYKKKRTSRRKKKRSYWRKARK